ncbi:MAG: hypothetical protein LKE53_09340 [Oscillospiraceae bacterium]|jgi:hypothetical protein|nr:hypothetical protein [Oscillospiraceae bacterium]MDD3260454.1 hypothetical protein [Oscillospiraceae bacterium]
MAREQYLLHQGEETIHSEDLKRDPQTPKDKRANFWYYHKWHVLIAIAAILLASLFLYDLFGKTKPDYQIGLITKYQVDQETINTMQTTLAKYADDKNGDGKVVIEVSNYAVGMADTNQQVAAANETRLMGDFSDYSDMLFFCDTTGYNYIQEQGGWDTSHAKMTVPKAMQLQKNTTLTANMRLLQKSGDKKYETHKTYWDKSYQIFQKLTAAAK